MFSIKDIIKDGIELNAFSNRIIYELMRQLKCNIPNYDGIIIKKINSSDAATGSQSHIALGKGAFDMFPRLIIENYLEANRTSFKRRYVFKVNVKISKNNALYLAGTPVTSTDTFEESFSHPVLGLHNGSEQIELYSKKIDGDKFIDFRTSLKKDNYLIIIKEQNNLNYYFFQVNITFLKGIITKMADKHFNIGKIREIYEYLYSTENKFYFTERTTDKIEEIEKKFGVKKDQKFYKKRLANYLKRSFYCLKYAEFKEAYAKSSDYYIDFQKVDYNNLKNITKFSLDSFEKREPKERNRILYGAPGTGKSYKLSVDLELHSDTQIERVTFYSDYTYGKFVGMFKPTTVGDYTYQGGPFLRILCKALTDPNNSYFLIIEEINRTDAASVFGDVFQLLDRDKNGQSVYKIDITEDMKSYFEDENNEVMNKYFEDNKIDKIEYIKKFKMCLPENLYIWATMNSADQGVYPLDSAFKRRWSMEYVDIDNREEKRDGKEITFKKYEPIKWNDLRKKLNDFMDLKGIREDKQIGVFFLNDNELTEEGFVNKLLMYLSEDVFRHQKKELFKKNTYGKIKKDFEAGENIFISGSEELDALKSLFKKV